MIHRSLREYCLVSRPMLAIAMCCVLGCGAQDTRRDVPGPADLANYFRTLAPDSAEMSEDEKPASRGIRSQFFGEEFSSKSKKVVVYRDAHDDRWIAITVDRELKQGQGDPSFNHCLAVVLALRQEGRFRAIASGLLWRSDVRRIDGRSNDYWVTLKKARYHVSIADSGFDGAEFCYDVKANLGEVETRESARLKLKETTEEPWPAWLRVP